MRTIATALALLLIASVALADAAADARKAESDFAKAFADRDAAKFFSFVADDAAFNNGKRTLSGKAEVVRSWSELFKAAEPPFSWSPENVWTNTAGTVAFSTGPVYNAKGVRTGSFSSVWEKREGGEWKVVLDGPLAPCPQEKK